MLKIVRPSLKYADIYCDTLAVPQVAGSHDRLLKSIPAGIKEWEEDGKSPTGTSHFWLIDGTRFVGMFKIKNELVSQLLRSIDWEIWSGIDDRELSRRKLMSLGLEQFKKLVPKPPLQQGSIDQKK